MSTTIELTSEQISTYRETALRFRDVRLRETKSRLQEAWHLAGETAQVLKDKYHATNVEASGSIIRLECFTRWLDVDIGAWGIDPADTLRAIGAMWDLGEDIKLNLVNARACKPEILKSIEADYVAIYPGHLDGRFQEGLALTFLGENVTTSEKQSNSMVVFYP